MHKFSMIIAEAILLFVVVLTQQAAGFAVERRSAAPERLAEDYPDYQLGVKYDEYPMIVPKKRSAMLVNRLMVALKEAIQEEEDTLRSNRVDIGGGFNPKNLAISPENIRSMDLQRHGRGHGSLVGQQKGRVYWRCYFNAVTCF